MRYEEISDNETLDNQTGLVWMKAYNTELTFSQAQEYAEQISKETGQDWRVPTLDELTSLVDITHHDPASTFPDMPSIWFWSSSPYVGNTDNAWYVNFYYGNVSYDDRDYSFAVRLVRGG